MRELTNVVYELNLINDRGEEMREVFSHSFDSELYDEDIDGIDVMAVNYRIQDLQEKYGQLFLIEFTIEREKAMLQ